jgi:hypothetical protein
MAFAGVTVTTCAVRATLVAGVERVDAPATEGVVAGPAPGIAGATTGADSDVAAT